MESVSFDGYAYDVRRVAVPGGTVATYSIGTGPEVVLLVSGGPGLSCDYVRDTHARLAGNRYRVVAYDQLGTGASERPDDTSLWTIERAIEEAEAVRAALDLGRVHYLGQSWGAFMGIDYALAYPDRLKTLTLEGGVASVSHIEHEWERLRLALGAETVAMLHRHEAEGTLDHPEYQGAMTLLAYRHVCRLQTWPPALMRSLSPENYNVTMFNTVQGYNELGAITGNLKGYERLDQLHRIKLPVQLFCGFYDECTPAAQKLMRDRLPDSRLSVFSNSAHLPFMEEPEAYFAILEAFLDETSGAKV